MKELGKLVDLHESTPYKGKEWEILKKLEIVFAKEFIKR